MLRYTREKERSLKDEMYAGEIGAAPYELGGDTGCDYCAYRDICGFDLRISGCAYRRLEKLSVEEAVGAMAAAVEKAEGETAEKETEEKEKEEKEKGGEQE